MEPIAVYHERLIGVERVFALYPDRVEVRARWLFGPERLTTVRLASLKPDFRRLLIRYRWYRYAGWTLAIGLLLAAFVIRPGKPWSNSPVAITGLAVATAGGVGIALTRRKVPFVRFDPIKPPGGLDIAKGGPERGEFDDFVIKIRRGILKANA